MILLNEVYLNNIKLEKKVVLSVVVLYIVRNVLIIYGLDVLNCI